MVFQVTHNSLDTTIPPQRVLPSQYNSQKRPRRACVFSKANEQGSMNPINILKYGAEEEKAESARMSSFVGAIAIGDLVKTTLGPKGMDKILISSSRSESIQITNDGATILRSVGIDNPAGKVLVGTIIYKHTIICHSWLFPTIDNR
eukprot:gene5035-144_t